MFNVINSLTVNKQKLFKRLLTLKTNFVSYCQKLSTQPINFFMFNTPPVACLKSGA